MLRTLSDRQRHFLETLFHPVFPDRVVFECFEEERQLALSLYYRTLVDLQEKEISGKRIFIVKLTTYGKVLLQAIHKDLIKRPYMKYLKRRV